MKYLILMTLLSVMMLSVNGYARTTSYSDITADWYSATDNEDLKLAIKWKLKYKNVEFEKDYWKMNYNKLYLTNQELMSNLERSENIKRSKKIGYTMLGVGLGVACAVIVGVAVYGLYSLGLKYNYKLLPQ